MGVVVWSIVVHISGIDIGDVNIDLVARLQLNNRLDCGTVTVFVVDVILGSSQTLNAPHQVDVHRIVTAHRIGDVSGENEEISSIDRCGK